MAILKSEASTFEEISDCERIARVLAGEKRTFHDLVRPHEIAVYLTAYSVLGDPDEAERAAQQAVLQALLNLSMLGPSESFRTWLLELALHEAHRERERSRCADSL